VWKTAQKDVDRLVCTVPIISGRKIRGELATVSRGIPSSTHWRDFAKAPLNTVQGQK
jgi:hypothetical protein